MKARLLAVALAAATLTAPLSLPLSRDAHAATVATPVNVPDPASQIKQLSVLFRNGDINRLAEALIPPARWEEIRLVYELKRLEPTTEAERAHFVEKFARFTAPDAVDQLMAEIEPKLIEARPQAPAALLMGFGAMQMAVASPDSDLTAEQREALQKALPAIQDWAVATDFLSSTLMRQALTLLTDAARQSGIDDLDQLKSLPLEGLLDRAGSVFAAAKQAMRLYGVDVDAIAASLQVETLEVDGDAARVRTTITLFGAPLSKDHDLVLIDGRWYDAATARRFNVAFHDNDD